MSANKVLPFKSDESCQDCFHAIIAYCAFNFPDFYSYLTTSKLLPDMSREANVWDSGTFIW